EGPAEAAAAGRAVAAWRDVLADRGIVMTSVVALVFAGFQLAAGTFFALYLHAAFGLDAVRAAAYLALAQYVGTAARLGWGVASDRVFGGRRRGIIAFQGFVAALIGFALGLAPRLPGWLLPVLAVALGASLMGWNGLYMTLVAELAGPERAGLASGYSLVLTRLGIMVASPVFGYIADATGGYRASWLAFAALTLAVSCAFAVSRFAEPAARARAAAT
ncbi:MAG: MFS transporter, partial [Clostridia bacterium]|nr:MFS transporter [Clostridia bacterium]